MDKEDDLHTHPYLNQLVPDCPRCQELATEAKKHNSPLKKWYLDNTEPGVVHITHTHARGESRPDCPGCIELKKLDAYYAQQEELTCS
jgi:hypothetical protein